MPEAKLVLLAMRPWSFPMTIMVGLASIAYAYWLGYSIDWLLAGVAVAGSVLLHGMTNLLNDYYDTKYGVDRPGVGTVEYRPHPLVHGFMAPSQVYGLSMGMGLSAVALAAIVSMLGRPLAVPLAIAGFVLAYAYSAPPFKFKYIGLGELAVYLAWGIVIPLGVFYVAAGAVDLRVLAFIAPLGILVVNVLLANNIRDAETDRKAGVLTIAARMGAAPAARLFTLLNAAAYAIPTVLVIAKLAPLGVILPLITLPRAMSLSKLLRTSPPPDSDPRAAAIAINYALLYIIGLVASIIIL